MKKLLLPLAFITFLGAACTPPEQITFDNTTDPDEPVEVFISGEEQIIKSDRVGEFIEVKKPSGLPSKTVQSNSTSKEGPLALIRTTFGTIRVQLFEEAAPGTVKNFIALAEAGFYEATIFHRVVQGFMIQGGDPLTREDRENIAIHGRGGPGYQFGNEISGHKHTRGVISMANSGADTNGSQFFILTADTYPSLDGSYSVFGEVVRGMGVVDRIESLKRHDGTEHPIEDLEILDIEIQR